MSDPFPSDREMVVLLGKEIERMNNERLIERDADMMDIKTAQARVAQLEAQRAVLHDQLSHFGKMVSDSEITNGRLRTVLEKLVARIDAVEWLFTESGITIEPELTAAREALGHQLTTSTNM